MMMTSTGIPTSPCSSPNLVNRAKKNHESHCHAHAPPPPFPEVEQVAIREERLNGNGRPHQIADHLRPALFSVYPHENLNDHELMRLTLFEGFLDRAATGHHVVDERCPVAGLRAPLDPAGDAVLLAVQAD